jgi:hypothetical protein
MTSAAQSIHIDDNPTADDQLGRQPFARYLSDLIITAPADSSFRTGVYGEWGEGKTSVLRMMDRALTDAGCATATFLPWTANSPDETLALLLDGLADKLGLSESEEARRKEGAMGRVEGLAGIVRQGKDLHVIAKATSAVLDRALDYNKERLKGWKGDTLLAAIKGVLAQRKVVVFIDDLDRVRPELLPELLLNLRETLDLPNLYYVLALSPSIVEEGLGKMHKGWGSASGFLEKIIEYPAYLPHPTEEHLRSFIRSHIAALGDTVDASALESLLPLLPRNPRKLKLFLRLLAGMYPLLSRFDAAEVSFPLAYLCQMLRFEFPKSARRLMENREALQAMESHVTNRAVARYHERQGYPQPPAAPEPEELYAPDDEGPARRERFKVICGAIKERGKFGSEYGLSELLELAERPPAVTRKESLEAWDRFREAPDDAARSQAIREAAARARSFRPDGVPFLAVLLADLRARVHSRVADTQTQREQEKTAQLATSAGEMLAGLIAHIQEDASAHVIGPEEWDVIVDKLLKFAHFSEPVAVYGVLRRQDVTLLRLVTEAVPPEFSELLSDRFRLKAETIGRTRFGRVIQHDVHEELLRLQDALSDSTAGRLLARFRQRDGIEDIFRSKELDALERMAFDPRSKFHSLANRAALYEIAGAAPDDEAVQLNFLAYFSTLLYVCANGSSVIEQEGCKELLSNEEFSVTVWRAAVSRPLNLRTVGSLLDDLSKARKVMGNSLDYLDEPNWYIEMKAEHFADDPNDGDGYE